MKLKFQLSDKLLGLIIILSHLIVYVKSDIIKDENYKTIKKTITTKTTTDYNKTLIVNDVTKTPLYNFLFPPNLTVDEIKEIEHKIWHFYPWKSIDFFLNANGELDNNTCIDSSSANEDFPDSLFTEDQLRKGAIIFYFIGAIYFFALLTVICNDYFLPAVECICEDLKLSKDVAAATFMATATSTPEFFTNTISTFITKSDLGLGTIIGSLMFNTLGVAALASIAASKPVQLDWWPISRDCILYGTNLIVLIIFAWDGEIYWYEATCLVVLYFIYFIVMFTNKRIMNLVKLYVEVKWNCCKQKSYDFNESPTEVGNNSPKNESDNPEQIYTIEQMNPSTAPYDNNNIVKQENGIQTANGTDETQDDKEEEEVEKSLWRIPRDSKFSTFWFFFIWPAKFVLTITIPNPVTFRKLYPFTFFMCIILIGINSYLVVWMVVRIGEVFSIPDSVMGLTFLAAGGCLPEAISSVIMARKGDGGLGVSNSLGANSLAILFSLGMPWFIRTMIDGGSSTNAFVNIQSYGIEFTILSLLLTIVALYAVVALYGYRLKKTVGVLLLFIYTIFLTFAILVELDILIPSGNLC